MYACTSFRGAKTCKIGKKGVFLVIQRNFGKTAVIWGHDRQIKKNSGDMTAVIWGRDRQIKKNACKNAYLGSIFIPENYVIRVLFVSPWTSLIPPLAIRVPPPGDSATEVILEEEIECTLIITKLFKILVCEMIS